MTPAELIRAKAKSYKHDAYRLRHDADLAHDLDVLAPTFEKDKWASIYMAVAHTLQDVADELENTP